MLYGPSGSGKSWLVESCARELDVPIASIDVTALAVDPDRFSTALRRLLQLAGNSERRARLGIVCICGLEKVLNHNFAGIQIELARIIEGARFDVSTSDVYADRSSKRVNTAHLLFVAELALVPRGSSNSEELKKGAVPPVAPESRAARYRLLRQHGVLSQLLDAFPVIQPVRGLEKADLRRILGEPPDRHPEPARDAVEAILDGLATRLRERFDRRVVVTTTEEVAKVLTRHLSTIAPSKRFQRSLLDAATSQVVQGSKEVTVELTSAMVDRAAEGILTPTVLERCYRRYETLGMELKFELDAIEALASHAASDGGNARGLAATLNEVLARNHANFQAVPPDARGVRVVEITHRMVSEVFSGSYSEWPDQEQVA